MRRVGPSYVPVRCPSPSRREGRARAFTLVEALVAIVILGMTTVAIASITSYSIQSLRVARDYQTAAELLDQTMTRVDLIGPERLQREGPTSGGFPAPYERFKWNLELTPRLEGHLWEVVLHVTWTDRSVERSADVHTLLNDEPKSHDPSLRWDDL